MHDDVGEPLITSTATLPRRRALLWQVDPGRVV